MGLLTSRHQENRVRQPLFNECNSLINKEVKLPEDPEIADHLLQWEHDLITGDRHPTPRNPDISHSQRSFMKMPYGLRWSLRLLTNRVQLKCPDALKSVAVGSVVNHVPVGGPQRSGVMSNVIGKGDPLC